MEIMKEFTAERRVFERKDKQNRSNFEFNSNFSLRLCGEKKLYLNSRYLAKCRKSPTKI